MVNLFPGKNELDSPKPNNGENVVNDFEQILLQKKVDYRDEFYKLHLNEQQFRLKSMLEELNLSREENSLYSSRRKPEPEEGDSKYKSGRTNKGMVEKPSVFLNKKEVMEFHEKLYKEKFKNNDDIGLPLTE